MAEFTGFNGFKVKDEMARNIAKGRNQAVAYSNYAEMVEALNAMEKDEFKVGQNIYIGTVGVPDLWVYSVEPIVHNFTYESDEGIVEFLNNNVTIQCGYYNLAMLEGQKVDLTTINERLDECFQSVSNGKELIASAITDKKVPTDADATFAEMAANIEGLKLGSGNAQKNHVLAPYTFTNADGVEYTGEMTNQGAKTQALNCGGSYTIPAGYHNGSGKITANSLASQTSANAVAANITRGKTAWVNGAKVTGTRPAPVTTLTGSGELNSINVDDHYDYTVTFSTPFDNPPTVLLTPKNTWHTLKVLTVTRGGFTFRCTTTAALSGKYTWNATG